MLNLHAQFTGPEGFAHDRLLISAYDHDEPTHSSDGHNVATIATVMLSDPKLGERLREIAQAYRMGMRCGKE